MELVSGDRRVEPMICVNDYVQPISAVPGQHTAQTWWLVRKTVMPCSPNMVNEAPCDLETPPTFLEISEYEDPKTFVKCTKARYLAQDFAEVEKKRANGFVFR